jgi:hypothetical protein
MHSSDWRVEPPWWEQVWISKSVLINLGVNVLWYVVFKNMDSEKTFRTKTGFCKVTADKIILTGDGAIASVSGHAVGNSIKRFLIAYGVLSIGLLYMAYDSFRNSDWISAFLYGLFGFYLLYEIVKSRNNSAASIIDRRDIRSVVYNKGTSGLTRPRFEIEFNENGQVKKRLIMLPGTLSGAKTEADKAVKIMREEKLLS